MILNWNVHGLNNHTRCNVVRDLVADTRVIVVTLQDTKLDDIDRDVCGKLWVIVLQTTSCSYQRPTLVEGSSLQWMRPFL